MIAQRSSHTNYQAPQVQAKTNALPKSVSAQSLQN